MTSSGDLLLSERVYIAIFAHTGKWRAKRLPKRVVQIGIEEREKHQKGVECIGCRMQTFDVVIDCIMQIK